MGMLKRLLAGRAGDGFAQTAIVTPIVLLLTLGLVTLNMAAFASVNAANAANYGARVGSVTQQGAAGAAAGAAHQSVSSASIGEYQVGVSGGGFPGARITVSVAWSVPNLLGPLMGFFGAGGAEFGGTAQATFRQEGW